MKPEAPPPPAEPSASPVAADRAGPAKTRWRDKRWQTGTLTYTAGGLALLFLWLLGGDFGFQFKERAVWPTFQLLLKKFQASDLVTGILVVTLPQVLALVVNPIFGYLSDRHRGRWGRRIPFLLATTPIVVIAMVGLAFAPPLGRALHAILGTWSPGENTSVIVMLGLFWAVFEFCFAVSNALLFALITDVVPKEVVGRFFALFRVVSLGAGMLFNYYLLGTVEQHYVPVFLILAAVFAASFGMMCLKVKEGEYPPPPPAERTASRLRRLRTTITGYARDCLANPYYRWIYLASALAYTAIVPINLYTVYFAKAVDMKMDSLGKFTTVMLGISLVQAYPIGWLVDKFHPLRLTIVALSCYGIATLTAFFVVNSATEFGFAVVACGVMSGFWGTASASLGAVLFPKEKFGSFYGVMHVANAVGQLLVAPMIGWSLDRLHHDYRYMYVWGAGLAVLAVTVHVIVYRKFQTCGGTENYVPPI